MQILMYGKLPPLEGRGRVPFMSPGYKEYLTYSIAVRFLSRFMIWVNGVMFSKWIILHDTC